MPRDNDPSIPPGSHEHSRVSGSIFVGMLWWYSLAVLYPSQALKSLGFYAPSSVGRYPATEPIDGEGQFYCREYKRPVHLEGPSAPDESVAEFDEGAGLYSSIIAPITKPVHDESLKLMRRFVGPRSRILDVSCGPGTEVIRLASMVPDGEVVGVDLSAPMVDRAFAEARRQAIENTAFFQADVMNLPSHFTGRFDVVHCSFAFHHYRAPIDALRSMNRVLNAHGKAFLIDNGTRWLNAISAPFAKWADPGWVAFHTGEEFQSLFLQAGFSSFYWEEILPGVGACIACK